MTKRYFQAHKKLYILCVVIALCVIIGTLYQTHEKKHDQMNTVIDAHVKSIHDNVTFTMEEAYALQALVIGADGNGLDLSAAGPELYRSDIAPYIRALTLAPGGVVTQVYPQEGNEAIIGLDLYDDDRLSAPADGVPFADAGPELTNIVYTHPLVLPNGDQVIAGHLRVFLTDEQGKRYEWGVVSVFATFPQSLKEMGNNTLEQSGYAYRITMVEDLPATPDNEAEKVLISSAFEGAGHSTRRAFEIAGVPLELEAYPIGGWLSVGKLLFTILTAFLGVAFVALVIEVVMAQVRRLRMDATEDSLTGLLNRSAAKQRIERVMRSRDFNRGAFLIMDIDHFKEVNDLLGHQRGDEVLMECARLCRQLFREVDTVSRLGGDEFLIFLSFPGEPTFLEQKVERLLSVMRRSMIAGGEIISISASIGVATTPDQGTTFDELYRRADIALYHAKRNGRNQAVYYEEAMEEPADHVADRSSDR